MYAVIKYFMQW